MTNWPPDGEWLMVLFSPFLYARACFIQEPIDVELETLRVEREIEIERPSLSKYDFPRGIKLHSGTPGVSWVVAPFVYSDDHF